MKHAIEVTRAENFSKWYLKVVEAADLAEKSAVRGCMVIRPWGYGIWELMQQGLDTRFKDTGHENCYFPLFIPLSFIAKEAEHAAGFATEMAIVTHHRLKMTDGKLLVDPNAKLTEPLVVRPTSETIIADSFKKWIKSHRDLPILVNQWANVVRWEMRTRLFLRTAEFLWQEGHTAHADREDALAETLQMLEVYRSFAEEEIALPVIAGEKPANERFAGADNTFSIEAMMQDGKALQAGTSHYLGTNFAKSNGIEYQGKDGKLNYAHTTSWGASTRLIGGLVMTHGDDDGLRLPPVVAPKQVVIIPRTADGPLLEYCNELAGRLRTQSLNNRPIRVLIDAKDMPPSDKRWAWVKKGAPLIVEIGDREVAGRTITVIRRDDLRAADKVKTQALGIDEFCGSATTVLAEMQSRLLDDARKKRDQHIRNDISNFKDLESYFGPPEKDDEGDDHDPITNAAPSAFKGWVRASWAPPTGAALDEIDQRLKALKLTIRNAPLVQPGEHRRCIFRNVPGTQEILIARAY